MIFDSDFLSPFLHNFKKISSNETALLHIMDFDLYFDDILILFLLFFLYNEGVRDYYLFIALILLLINGSGLGGSLFI